MINDNFLHIINELKSSNWIKFLMERSNVFIVGGSVRDSFLNKDFKDIDLIVEGLSLKDIQVGLSKFGKVDIVGESFSVIKFKPFNSEKEPFDIAVPRVDRKIGTGHKGFEIVTENVTIIDDLKRRDFTINSIAVNINTFEILDPFNGLNDIKNKTIRATDKNAFAEDALRLLRCVQFSSRFKFNVESETLELMKQHSNLIKEISGERIFDELLKIVNKKGDIKIAFELLNLSGISKSLFDKQLEIDNLNFDNLDLISFFYVLCKASNKNSDFLKNRFKVDTNLEKNVKSLTDILNNVQQVSDENQFRFLLFKIFEKTPEVMSSIMLSEKVKDFISEIKNGKIPGKQSDIQITGDDIINMSKIKSGPEIGKIKDQLLKDALMNHFNWKNRHESIQYLIKKILL